MNDYKKSILQGHEQSIYSDVTDPTDIIIYLESQNIISPAEKQILSGNRNLTEKLVKILLKKNDGPWFDRLVEALSKEFDWISNSMKSQFASEHKKKLTYYLRGRGNVPPLPQHNITRQTYVQQLRHEIKRLQRDSYLVVHGMSGYGKTCLVVDALNDISLLENHLKGCVYWLSVGDLRDDEPDDLQCHQLQMKLCEMVKLPINNQKDLKRALTQFFSLDPNHSALLVIDKVRSWKVVDALNIGCKILVTTQDTDVVRKQRKFCFPVSDGFSENETVFLLKDFVLGEQGHFPRTLRDSAIKVHNAWRGHPMVIGLIAGELSELREESLINLSRWKEYERTPIPQNNKNARRWSLFNEQINSVIGLTVNKLSEEDKNLFNMLAVLVEDTNITTDVLEILWKLPNTEVQRAIDHFYKRSLVFKKFNPDLEKPVYGIHDIIMEYLKKGLTTLELKMMHEDLISKYFAACEGNFANLPQDNYIFSYLCHHIENAAKWNEFRNQLFSLQFIGSKLKATSPADLLLDLSKYSSGLVGSESSLYNPKVEDMKKFVNDSGWDIHQGEVDVVQCGLLQPKESFICKEATAEVDASKLYFWPLSSSERPNDLETNISNVSALSLINNDSVLPAEGRILLYPDDKEHIVELDMNYRLNRRSFKEKSKVIFLKMSPLFDKFLSALEDGEIHVWNLNHTKSNADTPPPSLRQKSYLHHFTDMRTTPSSSFKHSRRVTCVCFSSDGKRVLSSSEDGTVKVWNLEEDRNEKSINVHPNPIATSCCFVNNNKTIVYACQNMTLFFYNLINGGDCSHHLGHNNHGVILNLLCVSDEPRKLIIVQEWQVQLLMWEDEILKHKREGTRETDLVASKTKILHEYERNTRINCGVYHPRHSLLLGTSNGCLFLSEILSDSIKCSKFGSGEIKAVDMSRGRMVFAQLNSVKMCWPNSGQRNERRPLNCHLGWITPNDTSVYTTISNTGNLQVYYDGIFKTTTDHPDGCMVRVSTYGQHILIGTSDGRVLLFDINTQTHEPLHMTFPSEILYLSIGVLSTGIPVYLASAKSEDMYMLKAGIYGDKERQCQILNRPEPVVKTFICSKRPYLLAVLQNYSIMASELVFRSNEMKHNTFLVQEGRKSAKITDGCLSPDEDILVLSDEEACFHVVSLDWSQQVTKLAVNLNNVARVGELKNRLTLPLQHVECEPQASSPPAEESIDEVDGMHSAKPPECSLRASLRSYPLSSSSMCCCICPKGHLAAIGYDERKISVWDVQKKLEIMNFMTSERQAKPCQIKFSPYKVALSGKCFELLLCILTDCVSLWDLTPYISSRSGLGNVKLQCIGCVTASGNPLLELSINQTFSKFAVYDKEGSFFVWKILEPNECDIADVNKNGLLTRLYPC